MSKTSFKTFLATLRGKDRSDQEYATDIQRPHHANDFRFFLWLALTAENITHERATAELGLSETLLNYILQGPMERATDYMQSIGLPRLVAEKYPQSWKKYEAEYHKQFNRRLREISPRP